MMIELEAKSRKLSLWPTNTQWFNSIKLINFIVGMK